MARPGSSSGSTSDSRRSPRSPQSLITLLIGGLAIAALVIYIVRRPPAPPVGPGPGTGAQGAGGTGNGGPITSKPPAPVTLPWAEYVKMVRLSDEAIALLENEKAPAAEPLWEQIDKQAPGEPLVLLNRAVGQVVELSKLRDTPDDGPFDRANQAVAALAASDPKSWIPAWMNGRIELIRKDREPTAEGHDRRLAKAIRAFAAAAEKAPDQPTPWYELYQAARFARDESLQQQGRRALETADRLAPDNIFVLLDWLEVAASEKNPEFKNAIDRFRKLVEPLRAGIQRRTRADIAALLDQAVALADKGQWPQAMATVRRLNFIKSEDVAQADLRRVLPNPLAFVRHDFGLIRAESAAAPDSKSVAVRFTRATIDAPWAGWTDVQAVRWVDFDLDGAQDLVLLRPKEVAVFRRTAAAGAPISDGAWQLITRCEVPDGFSHMLVADMDRDDKPSGQAVPQPNAAQPNAAQSNAAQPAAPQPPVKPEANPKPESAGKPEPAANVEPAVNPEPGFFLADADIVLYGSAGVLSLRNAFDEKAGQRSLEVVAQDGGLDAVREVNAAIVVDFDHDGDLDLVAADGAKLTLWINRGNQVFDDVSANSILPPDNFHSTAIAAVDWDRDNDVDLILSDAQAKVVGILENLRHIAFRWHAWSDDYAGLRQAHSLAIVESDGNVSWDVVGVGPAGTSLVLTTTPTPGVVKPLSTVALNTGARRTAITGDFDNDGSVDIFAWGAEAPVVLRVPTDLKPRSTAGETTSAAVQNTGAATIDALPDTPADVTACDSLDVDADGDLDLVMASPAGVQIWANETPTQNHWINLQVRGLDEEKSGRVNHFAIGSVIELRSGDRYQAQLIQQQTVHFGLGAEQEVGIVRVIFTNGVPQAVIRPKPDQLVREKQRPYGSCPFVYTWNGQRFEFYTDLLWAAPLGLQIADGVIMRDRPWEYLKIDGDRLQPQEGKLAIRITEELWEAGYFDQVELIAVDHPANVQVYSNEKVGPPEIAQLGVHTVRTPRRPVAARDGRGRDMMELISQRDGRYAQCYQRTEMQGLAEEHFLELDLGTLERRADGRPNRVTLFLSGWIYPTDTSLNVALSQDPRRRGPRPPRVLIPDGDGGWVESVPFMGFPGGKTKTIAVDLTGKLRDGDARLRIVTTAELRWDEAFFTVNEEPAVVTQSPLKMTRANLRYRGFSEPLPRRPDQPEIFDYDQCETAQLWPPMTGMFTRFGDVLPLLKAWDDQMVVMGAGDEIEIEFDAGSPPPEGWKRDYLLHSVGWDKDCALHTVYGQSVEPMPFREMPSYPYAETAYPDSPELRAYLRIYQTRKQPPAEFWRRLGNPRQ